MNRLGQKGIGLVEVMVAAAILGGLVMAFMRISDQMVKAEIRMFEMMEVQDLTQNLRYAMSNPIACTKTFEDQFANRKVPKSGELSFMVDRNSKELARVGERFGPIALESMRFQAEQSDIDGLGNSPGVVKYKVFMEFTGTRSKNFRKTQSLTIPLLGEYLPGEERFRFDYCDSLSSPFAEQIVDLTMMRVCEGFNVAYNRASGSCDMSGVFNDMLSGQKAQDMQKMIMQMLKSAK